MRGDRSNHHLVVYTDSAMIAGAEQSLATLVEHLPPWVTVTAAGPFPDVLEHTVRRRPEADLVVMPTLATSDDAANLVTIRRAIGRLRPSAIHLNKTEVGGLRYVESVVRTVPRLRVLSAVHHVEAPGTATARLISRRLAAGADAIVAVSRRSARQLEAICGLPSGRVHHIANALPLPPLPPARDGDRFVVGALARFVPHKAVDQLISAVAATDGVHLMLGGDGPERGRLEGLAETLGIADRVDFPGWVDPDVVLGNCDIVASAATIEGHPMALLDARNRGLPIVATDVGGVCEIVDDGVTGFLVPAGHVIGLAKAIATLADDTALRMSMAAAARAAAEAAPDPTDMADAYCRLYFPAVVAPVRTPRPDAGRSAQRNGSHLGPGPGNGLRSER